MGFWSKRKNKQEELNEETRAHLEMAKRERVERGETEVEADRATRREFGNVELIKETTRDAWGWRWLEDFVEDVRYGFRVLRKNRGFAIVAILTLTLGIGANTALFSVVNAVLLNPLPYPEPQQLVTLHESKPNFESGSISYPNFLDWEKDNRTFSSMGIARGYGFSLTGSGEAEQVSAQFISSGFFASLGIQPVLGRHFFTGEDKIGAAPIVMVSAGLWKRKFGGSPSVIGKSISLDGKDYTVVGIIPASFDLYLRSSHQTDVYVPIGQWNNPLLTRRGAGLGIHGVGRLKPGVTIEQARADMDRVSRNLSEAYPDENKDIRANLIPMRKSVVGDVQPILLVLLGAVGFVLLIACVNVANLLLARSTSRAREFAIRAALGAGRRRLIRQLLSESLLLAFAGGAFGLVLAHWATKAALGALPGELPRASEIHLDTHVLFFTLGISLLAGIFFGLIPALKTSHLSLHNTLQETGRSSSGGRHRAQGVFVVLEMAMALVLLIGAGLMIRSLAVLWSKDPGFRPENVITFNISLPSSVMKANPSALRAAVRQLDEKFSSTPGVEAVSQTWGAIPIGSEDDQQFWFEGQPKPANESGLSWALDYIVEPDYLKVMGIPLKQGRFFSPQDDEHSLKVAVVDEVFAHKYFGNESPIGKRIILNNSGDKLEIVGIVGHVNQWGLDADDTHPLRAQLYLSCMQMPDAFISTVANGTSYVLRANQTMPSVLASLRRANQQINGEQVLFGVQTMNEIISDSLATRRFAMMLLGVFAGLALLLAGIGIYGVISYLVGQRTQEIGVRMAMGAQKKDVLRLVLGEGMGLVLLGVAIGMIGAFALGRLLNKIIYGVSATDPITFIGVGVLLAGVALAACYIPARRAMSVDPMVALRYE